MCRRVVARYAQPFSHPTFVQHSSRRHWVSFGIRAFYHDIFAIQKQVFTMTPKHNNETPISFVIAVNDEQVLRTNALASPALRDGHLHEIILQRNFPSASLAYNAAMTNAGNDLIVFMHQDVYLPESWVEALHATVNFLEVSGRNWGVLGCYGISLQGAPAGHLFSNGLNRELGGPYPTLPVQSLDEVILVLRKSSGLRFDPKLPHFHLYGADICLQARQSGRENYVMSNFCVHNSLAIKRLSAEFWQCAEYLRVKWRHVLPVKTCCVTLLPRRSKMWMTRARYEQGFFRTRWRKRKSARLTDPWAPLKNHEHSFANSETSITGVQSCQ